ncbi:hypothetical protein [Mucilaginibacter polytrichastri]|uniref:Uncharacterized protein n=1 Tax=Mucilaginibacter polytrichastri TaxID=1302689 RepID=A0A1Q5ZU91_9SPHI|nr:hypothetical protein [Mucilaginibacter polytrichastri]OKS85293.1 hypothetical protein RG47T_0737 [Mucilaginibacter polytrichastri]SFS41232.1 hypothetical protein SAMN04487890_101355 [Mucilaginibacter polytrichastri]
MSKHTDKLKRQLLEISEVVNAFQSEAVQLRIVEKLLDSMMENDRYESDSYEQQSKRVLRTENGEEVSYIPAKKKPGATKILYQLLGSDFFAEARSISSIAEYCREHFNTDFKTSELSGILLKLSNENKLIRQRSQDNNRFEYIKS